MNNYLKQFLAFIWYDIFVKSIPAHSFVLWFYPETFKSYTAMIGTTITSYPSYTALAFIIAFNIFMYVKMKQEQKNTGSVDFRNSDSRSERHQRSAK